MAEVSRTARVIQNAKVALFFYCINLILQFFSRKIFLDYLGAELLGLNTTAQNLLQFLNLAESGIGAAVAFALYKPLSQKNRQEIIDIVSLQGWFYRWVGMFVIAGSIVLMAFFPWIFAKANVPLIYAYGTFIAFLISALLGYFVNYKMIVLSADQKEYKITIRTQSIKIVKIFSQILVISIFSYGYMWWILLEAIGAIATSIFLNQSIRQEYPWLVTDISKGKQLQSEYSYLLPKIKQLFCHKFGSFVLTQTTPLVIYGFVNLNLVAIYGNYIFIVGGCLALVDAFSRGLYASIGNVVAEADIRKIKHVFWKILTVRLFVSGLISICFFELSGPFVSLWVGKEYVISTIPVVIMTLIYFIQMSRTCDMFLSAYGIFQDVWAPVAESFINLTLSIAFGYVWGLSGILFGVLVAQIVIVNTWKPYYLYKQAFKEPLKEYVHLYSQKILLLLTLISLSYFSYHELFAKEISSYWLWISQATILIFIYFIFGGVLFALLDNHFKAILLHFFSLRKNIR